MCLSVLYAHKHLTKIMKTRKSVCGYAVMRLFVYACMPKNEPKIRCFLAVAEFCMGLSRLCAYVILRLSGFHCRLLALAQCRQCLQIQTINCNIVLRLKSFQPRLRMFHWESFHGNDIHQNFCSRNRLNIKCITSCQIRFKDGRRQLKLEFAEKSSLCTLIRNSRINYFNNFGLWDTYVQYYSPRCKHFTLYPFQMFI